VGALAATARQWLEFDTTEVLELDVG